jgi:hypothetical protein
MTSAPVAGLQPLQLRRGGQQGGAERAVREVSIGELVPGAISPRSARGGGMTFPSDLRIP